MNNYEEVFCKDCGYTFMEGTSEFCPSCGSPYIYPSHNEGIIAMRCRKNRKHRIFNEKSVETHETEGGAAWSL